MAFLCPSRRSRQKKKKKEEKEPYLGRITGSSSVDTLVRVGLEKQHGLSPEACMVVLDDFTACAADEVNVVRGQTVYMLYTEQEWMYVLMEDGKEGFIPRSFAKPFRSPALKKRVPPTPLSQIRGLLPPVGGTDDDDGNDGDESNSPTTNSSSQAGAFPDPSGSLPEEELKPPTPASDDVQQGSVTSEQEGETNADMELPDILPFEKRHQGKWVAMFAYDVDQESDVKVTSGEVVTLLNSDDSEWYWVRRSGGSEGFVPRVFLCKLPDDLRTNNKVVAGHAFQPAVGRRGEGLSHRRSQSMTDHPVAALPAYLRSPLCHRPPPASNAQAVSSESSSGFYNVSRATAAAEAASRQRPHSSLGHPAISSSNNTQASSSSAGRTVQSPGQRPHSSMGFPLRSFLSRSQTSLPLAIESEAFPASALSTNQRLQSSAYPASPTLGQRPQGSGSVQGLPSASHRTSQRPHSSMDHPVPSSWGGLSQGLMPSFVHASSHQPTSSPTDQKPPLPNHLHVESASASALRDYQTNGKLSSPFMPSSSTPSSRIPLPSQQLPPQPAGPAPAFQPPVPPKPSLPSPTFPPSYNSSHQQSSAHHMYPATEPQDSSGSVQSINHTGTVMNNHSAFSQGKAQHSDMPTRLSSSLNQSQDGRRKVLMHQHSVPEFPNQHNWVGTTNSHTPPPTGPSSHGRHGPTSEARSRTFNPGISHPMLGEIGRSKSSTQIISTAPQLPSNVTELMTLHSFCSKGADDISVSSGEVVYSDLSKQSERDWLWVYSPRLARHGYIPRDNVRIPRSAGGDLRSENVARV